MAMVQWQPPAHSPPPSSEVTPHRTSPSSKATRRLPPPSSLQYPLEPLSESFAPSESISGVSLSYLEQSVRYQAGYLIKGLTIAPALSSSAPCVVIMPFYFHSLLATAKEIGNRRSMSFASFLRSKHGELLDAIISFANSIWTPKQLEIFEGCNCEQHKRPEVKLFYAQMGAVSLYITPLRKLLFSIFSVISSVAVDMKASKKDVIRLERNPKKRGKWPSSPAEFIPYGPLVATSAFTKWSSVAMSSFPLSALSELTACCPSLELGIILQEDLLLSIADLFSVHVNGMQRVLGPERNFYQNLSIELEIIGFCSVFSSRWFLDLVAAARGNRAITLTLSSIYNSLYNFMPLLQLFEFSSTPGYAIKRGFEAAGAFVSLTLSTTSPIIIHDAFIIKSNRGGIRRLGLSVRSFLNAPKCAQVTCFNTIESIKTKFKLCAGCGAVRYCSKECQTSDWKKHKLACKAMKVLLPIGQEYCKTDLSDQESEELEREFSVQIKEQGLTDEDVFYADRYIASHERQPGDMPWLENLMNPNFW